MRRNLIGQQFAVQNFLKSVRCRGCGSKRAGGYAGITKFVITESILMQSDSHVLVESIVDMAHALRRAVVAEGVETEAACDKLRDMGCDLHTGLRSEPDAPGK